MCEMKSLTKGSPVNKILIRLYVMAINVPAVAALAVPGASRDGATFALRNESYEIPGYNTI